MERKERNQEQEALQVIQATDAMSAACERRIVAYGHNASGEVVAGLALVGPNCLLFSTVLMPAPYPIFDAFLN